MGSSRSRVARVCRSFRKCLFRLRTFCHDRVARLAQPKKCAKGSCTNSLLQPIRVSKKISSQKWLRGIAQFASVTPMPFLRMDDETAPIIGNGIELLHMVR